jgi:LysR family nitrogen assimilation transcriptional regulator
MLHLRPLRYFIAIVDLGSLSRAAEQVGIAQPALSQAIAALETDFRVKLLHRTPQGTTPTEAGRVLYRHARTMLKMLDLTRQAVRSNAGASSGDASLGLSITTVEILGAPLLKALRHELPGLCPEVVALPNRLLRELLINGRIDIALLFDQSTVKGIKARPFAVEELFFITAPSASHGKRESSRPITFRALAEHDLLLPCRPHGVRVLLEAILDQEGIDCSVVAEIDAVSSLLEMVQSGFGATIMPWSAVHRQAAAGSLTVRPFAGGLTREIMLCVSDTLPLSDATAALCSVLRRVVGSLVASGDWRGLTVKPQAIPA